ncbi:MAG: translation elongation factor Ts [Candidatus Omnitrophota bacterium]
MAASVDAVKQLRERTGAGMMDCKAALESSGGDIEQAIDILRKKGVAQAAKRAGREAKEGLVAARVNGKKAALVEANCETDFVARTEDFKGLASLALEEALSHGENAIGQEKVSYRLAELTAKIGEKMLVRRAKVLDGEEGSLFTYIHANHKLGVIVELGASRPETRKAAAFQEIGKHVAMQVAASNPLCVARTEVPAAVIEREKAVFREEVKGKPENILEKIIQGKLEKFYQSHCLLDQPFIRDDKMTVAQLVEQAAKKLGDTVQVKRFVRFQLGETLPS